MPIAVQKSEEEATFAVSQNPEGRHSILRAVRKTDVKGFMGFEFSSSQRQGLSFELEQVLYQEQLLKGSESTLPYCLLQSE